MIGILLALQVNNWNDDREKRRAEAMYYCRMLEDFELDKKQIESIQRSIDNSIKHTNDLLLELDSGYKSRRTLMNKFVNAIRRDIYVPQNKTFEELIYSGSLNIIGDIKIKNTLIQYASDLESNIAILQNNRGEFTRIVYDFVNSSGETGLSEMEFVNRLMAPGVFETLPKDNWTKDKNSTLYKKFQGVLIFNLTTAGREKQLLDATLGIMDAPQKLLEDKCDNLR